MNFKQRLLWCGSSLLLGGMLLPINVSAQSVTSDGTLSTKVTSPDNLNFTITNGNQPNNGANLFHSFSQFSIPTGGSATFNLVNTPNISTIFSRVTGGNISNIDGLIQTANSSNPVSLFLLNPSGIIFGKNASLNIGGSFIGTTANSVIFSDGVNFSASDRTSNPLLTIAAPIGLNFAQQSGAITVQGTGHRITGGRFTPHDRSNNPIGLQVSAGKTLALIGNGVNFSGGIAAVEGGGHLEVGSVSNGQVKLNAIGSAWLGDYSTASQFNDVHLGQQSLLDASGSNGSIQIQGQNIHLSEGSFALIHNLGGQQVGGITINATEALTLSGNTSDGLSGSFIGITNLGSGRSGDITLSTDRLSVRDGGLISSRTYSPANSGNLTVDVAGTIEVNGFILTNPSINSGIATSTLGSGNAGNLTVSTGNLRLLNSGSLSSATTSMGQAGIVQINARDLIEIADANPINASSSAIVSSSLGAGNANDLILNTSRLVIRESGVLGSTALATGSAGSVIVSASESIEVSGTAAGLTLPSRILAAVEIVDPRTQALLRLPPVPSGNSGSVTINTPSLRITDGATGSVRNDGPGQAGNLQINANSILLDNQGSLTASTASGNGGDISLNLQASLLLRHNSLISATTSGTGNGGNLAINSPTIVGLENSDIIANAVQGAGGNIAINTQGLFGLKSRPQLTPESDITASSQFGISGTVNISNLAFTPTAGLIQLPTDVVDPSQRIAQGCSAYGNSRFVATGRGGLPEDPSDRRNSPHPWTDLRDLSAFRKVTNSTTVSQSETATPPIVEATGWQINAKGTVDIYAANNPGIEIPATNCAGISTISTESLKKGNIR